MKRFFIAAIASLLSLTTQASDYDVILKKLKKLDEQENTSLFTLGKNDQDQDIVGIIIGDPSKARTKHLVVGTHHGNERMSAEVPLLFAELVLKNPDQSYEEVAFYIIPVLNISGYNVNRREETGPDGSTYDANRDYEDVCQIKDSFKLNSTSLLAELVERENIIAAVTVHGYIGTFTFPWGTYARDYKTEDNSFMESLAKKAVAFNNYKIGTHGGAIYPATGAFEDWAYFKLGVWSFLLEIKNASSDLNKDALALKAFFKSAPTEKSTHIGQSVNCVEQILKTGPDSRP